MQHSFIRPGFDFIQLFAEGGGEGGTGAGAATPGQTAAAPVQPQTKGAKNPLANVQYGKQAEPAAAGQAAQPTDDARQAKFDALIKGEYKDLYEARIKDTVSRRLKGTEDIVARYNQLAPTLDLLSGKYGVDATDIAALAKAIEEDESFYEEEALDKGMSVQQVKEIRRMKRENQQLRDAQERQQQKETADRQYAAWLEQAGKVKEIYPSFDFQKEAQNEQFRQLILSNVPMQTAYEVVHKDDIIPAAMQFTAQRITEKVANSIRAGQTRPSEGAMGSRSAVAIKSDVSQLTRADRDEIDRRVARGEKIRF